MDAPYDQEQHLSLNPEDKVVGSIVFEADNLDHGRHILAELEELVGKLDGYFVQSHVESV